MHYCILLNITPATAFPYTAEGQTMAYSFAFLVFLLLATFVYALYCRKQWATLKQAKVSNLQRQNHELASQLKIAEADKLVMQQINQDLSMQIEQQKTEMDTFLYSASHNLKGPASSLSGLYHVAKQSVQDQSSLELFEHINLLAEDMQELWKKFTMLHQVRSTQLQAERLNCLQVLSNVQERFQEDLEEYQIQQTTEFDTDYPVHSSNLALEIIMVNLIENAIKFRSATHPPHIHIKGTTSPGGLVLQISDNGAGVPQAYRDKIFDMNFRGSQSRSGHGLGLYICRQVAACIGGDLQLKQPVNNTVFELLLPNISSSPEKGLLSGEDFVYRA